MTATRNRRSFLKSTAIAGAAITLPALQYSRVYGANDRLNIASVGTGGKGWSDLNGVAASPHVQVVALCDIDSSEKHLGQAAKKYQQARQYDDWRKLLDKSNEIEGVLVSTPDFMHAPIALPAMQLGKHVFCQKPLTHSVHEARQMKLAARKYKVVTQMCNQIQSHSAYRTAVHMVHTGMIGKVKEVHSWQSGKPSWPRHLDRPGGNDPVPSNVRWDLWQGVAEDRPYKIGMYHPFNWRGWQAYGTGQLGDFGCHILDPVFKSLKLGSPNTLTAEAPKLFPESWTDRATVHYEFPGTEYTAGSTLNVTWYDGVGTRPPREKLSDIPADYKLPSAGSVLVGEKGSLVIPHVAMPRLFPEDKFPSDKSPVVEGVNHYTQWADACRGAAETTSHFDYAGPLTETVLLGTIGIRFAGQKLDWNAESLKITNHADAQHYITKPYRQGWEPSWV
ncbi:oxidoreductase domain-containing protein [Rhodopirellula maiorica SM1]|uniref:Oxidoreductase domain-containing protein n=1 Tax=Rhodopirellula maiorica SM1 TaxID=1265738 RepID=M5RT54_9BACT|nr:Gfo/Idh/MocA family oxidoreductase [Rhodopirellula maiorica]EMI17149.1 oxidoreductase domain-containing protein [Rhodopirellula maiorica SM1]